MRVPVEAVAETIVQHGASASVVAAYVAMARGLGAAPRPATGASGASGRAGAPRVQAVTTPTTAAAFAAAVLAPALAITSPPPPPKGDGGPPHPIEGARVVRRLAREGYAVVGSYRADEPAAHAVEEALVAAGGRGALRRSDVSDPAAVRALFDYAESAFGPVRAVVHNAGVQGPEGVPLAETSEADFDRVFGINARGTFLVLREAARRVADGGRIVTLSSSVTAMPMPTYGPYAASKSAVETLTAVLARELGPRGVRVNWAG